jgi:maltose phosphorylase
MNQDYIKPDNWSIIEEGFDVERVKSSESLFSISNGAMGQRANFEDYTGKHSKEVILLEFTIQTRQK